jgi:hypothetical protein
MIKLTIGIIILLGAGIAWLRAEWGRSKNKNASRQLIDDLKSGKYMIESYAGSFEILIWSADIDQEFNQPAIKQYLNSLNAKKVLDKFTVAYADMDDNQKGIVIGEGLIKDYVHDKEIEVHYPCWIYIDTDAINRTVSFKSTFPENKDHHYLLEDLSQEIYKQCMKN